MSGDSLPYHLRAHKAVDRRIFMDLLTRFERWKPLLNYVYISMGAYPLEDHKLIHRVIGISKLIAFDLDDEIVARQQFNRPLESCHCLHMSSGELISRLETTIDECSFSDSDGIIVWLDYTKAAKIGTQIREFQSLLDKCRTGDLVRVTVNANPNELNDQGSAEADPVLKTKRKEMQFQKLKNRVGEFLPSTAGPEDMTEDGLPIVIAQAFGAAAMQALPVSGETTFLPLSLVRYRDTTQMLSITGVVAEREHEANLLEKLDMASWPLASKGWHDVKRLIVPALTLRERLLLERGVIKKSAEELMTDLGFVKAANVRLDEFINSYRDYYRFYPTMLSADV